MEKTWLVMCPNWRNEDHSNRAQGWSLSKQSLEKIGQKYSEPVVECITCGNSFTLVDGLAEAFVSDLVIHYFQSDTRYSGSALIKANQIETINFPYPFENKPAVYLTPYGPMSMTPGNVTTRSFDIFNGIRSKVSDTALKECRVSWAAFGNSGKVDFPVWRRLLASSKTDQLRKDFRLEIVDLESSFEIFVANHLQSILTARGLRKKTVEWILKHRIDLILSVGFKEATGQTIPQRFPDLHRRWKQDVKELRDSIIHRGVVPTEEQAMIAREIVFKFMMAISPNAIEHLQIQFEKVRSEGPNMTFGVATIKAGSKTAEVEFGWSAGT